jgi:hypothetical protein
LYICKGQFVHGVPYDYIKFGASVDFQHNLLKTSCAAAVARIVYKKADKGVFIISAFFGNTYIEGACLKQFFGSKLPYKIARANNISAFKAREVNAQKLCNVKHRDGCKVNIAHGYGLCQGL